VLGIVSLAGTSRFDVFGWHAPPNLMRRYLGVLQYQGSGSYDGTLAYFTAVEQRGAHADKGMIVDGAGVYGDVVTYGDVVADMRRSRLMGDMDTGTVLHISAVANGDGSHVATDYGIEPDGTLVTHGDIANDGGILTEIALFAPLGRHAAI